MTEAAEGKTNWKKLKQHVTVASKINNRISSANFIGEDLKFADDSLEGRVALTLQLGVSQIINTTKKSQQDVVTERRASALFRSPIGCTSMELDSVQLESINEPLDDHHTGYTFSVNGETCEFIEYYPEIFSMIRDSFDIDLIEYKAVLGTNIQTECKKLTPEETSSSTSSLKPLSEINKKLNASFKEVLDRTELTFKSLSKRPSPPDEQPTPDERASNSSPQLNEKEQESHSASNKILTALSDVSSKIKAAIDQAKQPGRQTNDPSSSSEETLRSTPMIRSSLRFIGTKDASGKSCSWFLFSPDMRYCCKTTKPAEAELLMKILPSYAMHCESYSDTLLPRFYGLYRIQVMGHVYWFIIQGNVFASPKPISERYDVKGSTQGRTASEKEKSKGVHTIFKDLDLIQNERFLCFENQSEKDELLQILSRDVDWLESHALMDYSFLLGFVDTSDETPLSGGTVTSRNRFAIKSLRLVDERFSSVYVGLIDILTEYMLKKKVETFMTGTLLLQTGISCQPPQKYAQRMVEFIDGITIVLPQEGQGEGLGRGSEGAVDSGSLKLIRAERKKQLEELIEKNLSQPLEWIKETTNDVKEMTGKAHQTIQSELDKIRDIIEKKSEGAPASPATAAAVDSPTNDL